MVGEDDDLGVLGHVAFIEGLDHFTEGVVHGGSAGEVGLGQGAEVCSAFTGPIGRGLKRHPAGDSFGDGRKVVHVVGLGGTKQHVPFGRCGVEPLLRREQGQVRVVEAKGHEAGSILRLMRLTDVASGPFGDAQVGVAFRSFGVGADVPDAGGGDFLWDHDFLGRVGALAGLEAGRAAQRFVSAAVEDLAGGEDVVAGLFKALGHPWQTLAGLVFALRIVLWPVSIDA